MTDLKNRLMLLLTDEPDAPDDLERIVGAGRRARRRRGAAVAAASTFGAAGLTAAVVIPVVGAGGHDPSFTVGTRPSATPSAVAGECYFIAASPKAAKHALVKLERSGRVGTHATVKELRTMNHGTRTLFQVCARGAAVPTASDRAHPRAGSRYHYTEQRAAIAARLGDQLRQRVTGFGLTITYTRPFAQESSSLDSGHPSYYDGNVDVHEANGYADIGIQVRHARTELVPFEGDCSEADHCVETQLPDGGVLRTAQVKAGRGDTLLTAEVHRPDGVVVQAQESNYPFGPDAASQAHGDQPLTLDRLVSLAEDDAFSF